MAHAEKNVLIVQSLSGVKNATNSEINSTLHNLWYGKRDKLERLEMRKGNDKGELKMIGIKQTSFCTFCGKTTENQTALNYFSSNAILKDTLTAKNTGVLFRTPYMYTVHMWSQNSPFTTLRWASLTISPWTSLLPLYHKFFPRCPVAVVVQLQPKAV